MPVVITTAFRRLAGIALLCAPLSGTGAQIVRGVAVERESRLPLPGVVVTLEDLAANRPAGNALTTPDGRYAIRAPSAGRYRVSAKRIGVARYVSESFALREGETRQIDIELGRVTQALDEVTVVAPRICALRGGELGRVAALWDEIQTALTATQISAHDQRFEANVYRYVRQLALRTHRVLGETRSEAHGRYEQPFRSITADSLSELGYWQELGSVAVYHVPDPDALLSDVFLRDHCFRIERGRGAMADKVGLAFEPARGRRVPEVRGILWVDGRSFELRQLSFTYTRFPEWATGESAGGEVRFARLPNGAWLVRRWHVQMPQFAIVRTFEQVAYGVPARQVNRRGLYRVVEEGGSAFVAGASLGERLGAIAGDVRDTLGAPLRGAAVRLGGSPFTTARCGCGCCIA